jgi:SAM-dependent methyltransferase
MSLAHRRILEVGCGAGHVLLEFLAYGAHPVNLYGVDLLLDRIVQADARLPHLSLGCADGQNLPFPDHAFDLVMQFTVFSSILDSSIKANIAAEMQRVVRPDGLILSYDFWLNPTNRQTRGIRPSEIRRLFPGAHLEFYRITLAPPIARRLAPCSWLLCCLLERLQAFNTHYLVAIKKTSPGTLLSGREDDVAQAIV